MEESVVIREMREELDRDIAQCEANAQELSRMLVAKLEEQNPQLTKLIVKSIDEINVNMRI